jgi:molybdopterin-containing oxidoreductase family membrane subunit
VEICIFIGTLGLFFTLFLLFTRVAPVVAIAEVKSILKTAGDQYIGPNKLAHAHAHGVTTPAEVNDMQAGGTVDIDGEHDKPLD